MNVSERIIVALDGMKLEEAEALVQQLAPIGVGFKVGLEFICGGEADQLIRVIKSGGGSVFYDGKLNDIPNTVGKAAKRISVKEGIRYFNVHASAGIEAMMAAVENKGNSQVLAVTVLTSLEENNAHLLFGAPSKAKVLQLARDAKTAGVDGIICSPQELELLGKQKELLGLLKITPGVRPEWAAVGDQKRIMTPADAVRMGATALVIGRPITKPPAEIGTPANAVNKIIEEIGSIPQ